jgi:hypothetical protein
VNLHLRGATKALTEEWQDQKGVGLHASPFADFLGLGEIVLGHRSVAGIEVERSKAVVARE